MSRVVDLVFKEGDNMYLEDLRRILKENPDISPTEATERINKLGHNKGYTTVQRQIIREKNKNKPDIDIVSRDLIKKLSKETHINELCELFNVSERVIKAHIEDLKELGYQVVDTDNIYKLMNIPLNTSNRHVEEWKGNKVIRFGAIGDTHLCSKHQQITFLNDLYNIYKEAGIDTVYHAGDLAEGYYKNRPEHIYEIFKVGADEQADYIIENYPRVEGITTKFITGNHDHTHIKNGGTDIGKKIAREREDLIYLGSSNVIVNLTPNCTVELNHPLDGTAYALSYSLQKYMDSMQGGEKPNILLNGHHHKAMYLFYRNIHGFEVGTIQAQSPWMKGKRLSAHMGGWIIEIQVDTEGTIVKCKGEFIPLYKPLKEDY